MQVKRAPRQSPLVDAVGFDVPEHDECPFCAYVAGLRECWVLAESHSTVAFLNERQRSRGAVLVVPRRHAQTIFDVTDRELADLVAIAQRVGRALVAVLRPDGLNLFQNNGTAAGQTIGHLHLQVTPRYMNEPYSLAPHTELPIAPAEELAALASALLDATGDRSHDLSLGRCGGYGE